MRNRELELKAEQEKALLKPEKHLHLLKMAGLGKHLPLDRASAFDPARNIRLVPHSKKRRLIERKELARFLGMAGYYWNFCCEFFGNNGLICS